MSTPINTQPSPFTDPNNALRQFNEYFAGLRKDYGEDAIRAMGFTPRDLAALQASLRNLQMDPSATPEQHRQAFMQARDALAQRVTTPLASTRSYAQVQGLGQPSPQSAADIAAGVVQPAPAMLPMATPTQEQLYEYARGVAKGQQSQWDPRIGKFVPAPTEAAASPFAVAPEVEVRGVMPEMPPVPPVPVTPPPPMRLYVDPEPPMPVPSATDYISGLNGSGSNEIVATQPRILPGIMPMQPSMNTQPGADFDRNVGRQIFDAEFRTLREKYGDDGLRAAGFTPRTLSALQAPLTNVQKDNTISYDQSSAALENALQQLRGYNFGGAQPAAPMQPVPAPAAAAPNVMPNYYRGGPVMRYR